MNNSVLQLLSGSAAAIGGADGPTAIQVSGAPTFLGDAIRMLGQGMAGIFVVLGVIAVVVWLFKRTDNRKKNK